MQFAHAMPEAQLNSTQFESMKRFELMRLAVEKGLIQEDQPTPTKNALVYMLGSQSSLSQANLMTGEQSVPLNISHDPKALREHIAKLQEDLQELEKPDIDPLQKMTDFLSLGSEDGRGQVMAMKAVLKKECGIELPKGSTKEDCVKAYEEYLESSARG